MVTVDDIKYFYEEYRKNLDEEETLVESDFEVKSMEQLSEIDLKKSIGFEKLYKRNMQLLSKYLEPFLSGEQEYTGEIVDALLDEIYKYVVNEYFDAAAVLNILLSISNHYESMEDNSEHRDRIIFLYHLLGYAYTKTIGSEMGTRLSKEYYYKDIQYRDVYFELDNLRSRKAVVLSMHNYCVELVNQSDYMMALEPEKIYDYQLSVLNAVEDTVEFYNNPRLREQDEEVFHFDQRIKKVRSFCYGNIICDMCIADCFEPHFLEVSSRYLDDIYNEEIKDVDNIFEINDDIFSGYWISKYLINKISVNELLDILIEYSKYGIKTKDEDNDEDFYESKYFAVCNTRMPILLYLIHKDEVSKNRKQELAAFCVENYLEMMEWMPHYRSAVRISESIRQSAKFFANYLPQHISKENFLLKILINRDIATIQHGVLVRQLSYIILNAIYEEKPELLIGTMGTTNIMDVLNMQEEIFDYVRRASMIFDIGKTFMSGTTSKKTRDYTKEEIDLIYTHPQLGCNVVDSIQSMEIFRDVIMGHHKYYDGSQGYPSDWDNTTSPYRFITDIITICDNLDSFTEVFGDRIVKDSQEVVDEFSNGAGTKYNPDIIALINSNTKLQKELEKCCVVQRKRINYEVYYEYIKRDEQTEGDNNHRNSLLPVWTQSALNVLEVDFYRDSIKTIYRGNNSISFGTEEGRFSEVTYDKLSQLFHPDDVLKVARLFDYGTLADKLKLNNNTFELEVRVKRDEEWMWIRLQFFVEEEHYGIPQKIYIVLNDADEQCRKRQKMQEALEQARQDAKKADKAKTMFISNISHEIRTPMNAIVGMVEILLRTDPTDIQKEYLMNIKNSGNALLTIINDILDFSKMESGKFEIIDTEYEFTTMLNEVSMIFLNRIGEKPVELIFEIDKDLPKVLYGDSLRVRQVIINLMNNAIKFTDQGQVVLKVEILENIDDNLELKITVKDSGIGIKEEDIGKLFGQFQQIDVKKNYEKEGTGLGLVISKQLVELMGGNISVSSVYGEGSEFVFTIKQKIVDKGKAYAINYDKINSDFSVACLFNDAYNTENFIKLCSMYNITCFDFNEKHDVSMIFTDMVNLTNVKGIGTDAEICVLQNPMIENIAVEGARVLNKPFYVYDFCMAINHDKEQVYTNDSNSYLDFVAPDAKILVVDDTEMNLTVAKGLLQPLGMHIDTANSGMKAIELIQSKDYDLIFMDHKMPGMDGIDTTVCIRTMEDEYYKTVPIIALTANAVLEARQGFKDAGMNDFVAKPIEIKDIIQKIKKWLRPDLIKKPSNEQLNQMNDLAGDISEVKIPGLNVEEGIKNAGGYELFANLVCDYYKLIDSKSGIINDYLAQGMIKEYTIEVHAMKSVSRVIGALELSEMFKELEALGDKGEVELLYEKTPVVIDKYIEYKVHLREFVMERESLKNKDDISVDELIEILEIMSASMQSCDLDVVDECMNKLDNCNIPESVADLMEKLSVLVADVDMENSIQVMTQMSEKLRAGL